MREPVLLSSRLFGLLAWLLGAALLAGCVHIVSVLAMPRLAPQDAYARIEALAPIGKMTLLQQDDPKSSGFPFEDPAIALGACRFDLRQGPLQIMADLRPDRMFLFSFHSRHGRIFYSMSDRVAPRGRLDVLVLTPDQLTDYEANDNGDELPKELRIVSPSATGFMLARAFAEHPDDRPAARRALAAIDCATVQPPQI